jgi:hypothetical protein
MSAPTHEAGPAKGASLVDSSAKIAPTSASIPSSPYTKATRKGSASTHAIRRKEIRGPDNLQVTQNPPLTGENAQSAHDTVERAHDPRPIDTLDAEHLDESAHHRIENNHSPEALGGRNEHAKPVAAVEPAKGEPPSVSKKSSQKDVFSTWEKFGWLSRIFIIGGLIVLLAAIGFLTFLWFGNWTNHTWNIIASRNWVTRSVSLTALAVRTAVSLQAGVTTSMLASVALEQMEVHIFSAASISSMRNTTSGPHFFTWSMLTAAWKRRHFREWMLIPTLAVVLTITTVLVQFTSTALLADLSPGVIPSSSRNYTAATNFVYDANGTILTVPGGTTWKLKAPFCPAFAEYHEDVDPSTEQDAYQTQGLLLEHFSRYRTNNLGPILSPIRERRPFLILVLSVCRQT